MTSAMSTLRSNQSELTAQLRLLLYHKTQDAQMRVNLLQLAPHPSSTKP